MSNQSDSSPQSPAVRRVAFSLRRAGWISFWIQLVLAVVSGIILLFAILVANQSPTQGGSSGVEGGLLFAFAGLGVLGFSTYRAFYHTRLSQQLRGPQPGRPSRGETMKQMRVSLIANMVGMLLTLLGAEAINGILLAKAVSQPRGILEASVNVRDFVQPLDIFIVLANTHTIVAHFVGILSAIWLIEQIYKE
ncbi:DUF3611 family protein [Lyngbya sp. PCC 8106]|uniref:DUF3611 family protein n=1 Tax=Lyngbya sp. (strain PCC 8106) TaxID=313612 RepID=UPI0000EAB0DC|nr:DUF3611 family protein [Lyngbya sp. PCC 8106]EAW39256.1 hypothetical protein L8106_04921 [Lyngbya sp. PCC 8106]